MGLVALCINVFRRQRFVIAPGTGVLAFLMNHLSSISKSGRNSLQVPGVSVS